jgi:hypothetical protein
LLVHIRLLVELVLLQWKNLSCKLVRFESIYLILYYRELMWGETGFVVFATNWSFCFLFLTLQVLEGKPPTCNIFSRQVCAALSTSLVDFKFKNCFLMKLLFCSMLLICSHIMRLFFQMVIMKKKWNWSRRQEKFV